MPEVAGLLVHARARREPISRQLQLPLLRKNGSPARALHIGEEVDPIGFYGIRDGIITRAWCLLLYIGSLLTLVEPAAPIERLLVLGEMLGVIKISAAAQHIHGFILARPRKVLQSLVFFIIGYEICINGGLQFLGYAVLGRMEYALVVLT